MRHTCAQSQAQAQALSHWHNEWPVKRSTGIPSDITLFTNASYAQFSQLNFRISLFRVDIV